MRSCILLFVSLFLLLVSCSKEEMQYDLVSQDEVGNSTDFLKTNELLTSNFLPTFTSYYGKDRGTSTNRSSSLASEWLHEYDDNQRLVKSYFYELYPYRILKEFTYHDIEEDHKLKYEVKEYGYYGLFYSFTDTHELIFDENMNIKKFNLGDLIKELSDEGWVTKIHYAPNGSVFYQTGFEYDEQGNILKYLSYDISGTNYATVDYSYNENGDPITYHFQNIYGAEVDVEYYYREDNTLARLEEEYYYDDEDFGSEVFTYTPEERFSKRITNRGDGSKQVVIYTGDEIIEEHFKDDVLSEIFIFQVKEEDYSLKLHKEYLNGVLHKIKYFDANGELDYTEYYDENGSLTETVYE